MRFFIGAFLLLPFGAGAQVYSPKASEYSFTIEARFVSSQNGVRKWRYEADRQLAHAFGTFHSPGTISGFGLDPDLIGGIGAIQAPVEYEIKETQAVGNGKRLVHYEASGKILLHKTVGERLIASGPLTIPLPLDVFNYYDQACTDEHYHLPSDFWYFFDVNREGCEYLAKAPFADSFSFKIRPSTKRKLDENLRLDLLRGNNDNGALFRIDVVHGFSDSSVDPLDMGREGFSSFNEYLIKNGYNEKVLSRHNNRPLHRYSKSLRLANGKTIEVQINSLLVESGAGLRTVTFAKFFKEAVQSADVVYYTGHSGLGSNLDIALLEKKAGGFKFNGKKRQIFFFDGCSTYSYYLDPFRDEKTRARLDIVTNGLSSLFNTGLTVLSTFLEQLTDPDLNDTTWPAVLGTIEDQLEGSSYLINVGGI
ncbi:MAG: hypothetical protein AB7N80_01620 [Bdellovibrionales bacterium]